VRHHPAMLTPVHTAKVYDTIVVGLGMAGASTLRELAKRGHKVLGLERWTSPNSKASHHGDNRIFRIAYAEHPSYVPMLRSAQQGWLDAEAELGTQLLHVTGSIHGGPADSAEFQGALKACTKHALAHEVLDSADLRRRFSGYRLPDDHRVVFQPDGGFVCAEASVRGFVDLARRAGADVREHEPVLDWQAVGGAIRVTTPQGEYHAARLVLTAGAWMPTLCPTLRPHLTVTRQVVAWLQTSDDSFLPERFPVFTLDTAFGPMFGFPAWGRPGLKIGRHGHRHERVLPDEVQLQVDGADEAVIRAAVRGIFPAADGPMLSSAVGLYTSTRDEFFVLDQHPEHPQVVLASPCSGHGFKFMPVIGKILSDLAEGATPEFDIRRHRLRRLLEAATGSDR
jgi:sarcosine oxidase